MQSYENAKMSKHIPLQDPVLSERKGMQPYKF